MSDKPKKVYSYIITHDTGFSPNPFCGYCTLANCKPIIRRKANIGDWVVGLSRKSSGNLVVFAMEVCEILDYEHYYNDQRFANKIPNYANGNIIGDNIYKPLSDGKFRQLQSMHSNGKKEDMGNKAHDLKGINVLIAKKFYYFGGSGKKLPCKLNALKVGRGHKNKFSQEVITDFLEFISSYTHGVNNDPSIDANATLNKKCGTNTKSCR